MARSSVALTGRKKIGVPFLSTQWTSYSFDTKPPAASDPGRYNPASGRFQKLFAEIGMSDVDEHHGPFPNGLPMQISDAVFCHDIMNISTCHNDAAARGKMRDNA
jgi:hypothetical protein